MSQSLHSIIVDFKLLTTKKRLPGDMLQEPCIHLERFSCGSTIKTLGIDKNPNYMIQL
ncbi:hypothetical protein LINGRAPRIM_LOCUS760 [Linum grandiflorum]